MLLHSHHHCCHWCQDQCHVIVVIRVDGIIIIVVINCTKPIILFIINATVVLVVSIMFITTVDNIIIIIILFAVASNFSTCCINTRGCKNSTSNFSLPYEMFPWLVYNYYSLVIVSVIFVIMQKARKLNAIFCASRSIPKFTNYTLITRFYCNMEPRALIHITIITCH